MPPYRFLVLNGPNLGHLGQRQPEIYGTRGMEELPGLLYEMLGPRAEDVELIFFQSNHEGALIDRLEAARREHVDGVILNAGALTHSSLALADCLAWIGLPCVEVHLSNVLARASSGDEAIRAHSHIARHCLGVIAGFGLESYALAALSLLPHMRTK